MLLPAVASWPLACTPDTFHPDEMDAEESAARASESKEGVSHNDGRAGSNGV
jgi:hypothetical protein